MERLSAWKVFKYTMAISVGVGFGKRIVMAADAALLAWAKVKHPEIFEKATKKAQNEEES